MLAAMRRVSNAHPEVAPRLVFGQQLRRRAPTGFVLKVDIRERLSLWLRGLRAVAQRSQNVRFFPDSDRFAEIPKASLRATNGHSVRVLTNVRA